MHPIWLLDVDGVINAFRRDGGDLGWGEVTTGTATSDHRDYELVWAPPLVQRILALHHAAAVDVRWCTTWCDDAGAIEALVGIPPLVRADISLAYVMHQESKIAAAMTVLAAGHPLVWTDDNAIPVMPSNTPDPAGSSSRERTSTPRRSTSRRTRRSACNRQTSTSSRASWSG